MIKTFIIRFMAFVLAALILFVGICLINRNIMREMMRPEHLSIGKDNDVIILGDSHTQTGIDETLLTHAVNISANSMHYLYAYGILQTLLNANPQVKAVVLGYSYHNLNDYYDGLLNDQDKTRYRMGDYYGLFGPQEKALVRSHTFSYFVIAAQYEFGLPVHINPALYLKAMTGRLTARDFPFSGKTHTSRRSNISSLSVTKTLQRHFYRSNVNGFQQHSVLQKRYLQKMIDLCRSRNVRLVLLMTPVHPAYRANIPGPFKEMFASYTAELLNNNPDLAVWDHSSGVFADFMYGDADHLNFYGAQIFSTAIDKRLKELRGSDPKE